MVGSLGISRQISFIVVNAQLKPMRCYIDTQKLYTILAQVSAVATCYSNILLFAFCHVFVSPKQIY